MEHKSAWTQTLTLTCGLHGTHNLTFAMFSWDRNISAVAIRISRTVDQLSSYIKLYEGLPPRGFGDSTRAPATRLGVPGGNVEISVQRLMRERGTAPSFLSPCKREQTYETPHELTHKSFMLWIWKSINPINVIIACPLERPGPILWPASLLQSTKWVIKSKLCS